MKTLKSTLLATLVAASFAVPFVSGCGGGDDDGGSSTSGTTAGTTGGIVNPTLLVTGVAPTTGPAGTIITVTGSGFKRLPLTKALFVAASGRTVGEDPSPQVISDTKLTITAPEGSGTVDIQLQNANGVSAKSAADQFTYATADTTGGPPPPPTAGTTAGTTDGTTAGTTDGTTAGPPSPTGGIP